MTSDAEGMFALWARSEGWIVTKRGWPDYFCRRGAEIMAVEVKDGIDWLKPEQRAALMDLHASGVPTFIWTRREGLMAYPQPHVKSFADQAGLAYELERTRDELTEAKSLIEILRTQVAPAVERAETVERVATAKLSGAADDLERMAEYILKQPNVPEHLVKVAEKWKHGGWRRWRLSRVAARNLDKTA